MHSVQNKSTPVAQVRHNSAGPNMTGGNFQHNNQGGYQGNRNNYQGNRQGGYNNRGGQNPGQMGMRNDHQQYKMNQQNAMPQPMANAMPQPMPNAMPPAAMPQAQPSPAGPGGAVNQMQLQFVPSSDPMSTDFYSKTMPIYAAITEINPSYKQTVGSTIFEFVTKLVGPQFAPKITGMLIDLPIVEIQRYVTNFDLLSQRVKQAEGLLHQQQSAGTTA